MWDSLLRKLRQYPSAILTAQDSSGYAYSVRCIPEPDRKRQALKITLPEYVEMQPGPAGLLCHYHDDLLWNQTNFVLRGTLEHEAGQWIFRPLTLVEGAGAGMNLIRQIRDGRQSAKLYLAKHGVKRPAIPWSKLAAIYKRARSG